MLFWESKKIAVINNWSIQFFCPEGHATMRNFLTPLWNEGKQPCTFNSEVNPQLQVDSDNQTFSRKKTFARQRPTLWIKLDLKIKFWHTCRLFWLNPGACGEDLTSQQWEIFLVVISKSCLCWFDSYWRRLMLRKFVMND